MKRLASTFFALLIIGAFSIGFTIDVYDLLLEASASVMGSEVNGIPGCAAEVAVLGHCWTAYSSDSQHRMALDRFFAKYSLSTLTPWTHLTDGSSVRAFQAGQLGYSALVIPVNESMSIGIVSFFDSEN